MLLIRWLLRLSDGIVRVERLMLILLVAALVLLVLLNVGARFGGLTLAWADELAVLSMVWAGFVGASLMLRARMDPAVRLLHAVVGPALEKALRVTVSGMAVGFGAVLIWMNWIWFDPAGMAAAGFDIGTFEGTTFNFLYSNTTNVLLWPYFWFYLIVPWFALTITVHALTNLVEDVGFISQRALAAELVPPSDDVPAGGAK